VQLLLAVLVTAAALAFLLWPPGEGSTETEAPSPAAEAVTPAGPHRLSVRPGTPLEKKLAVSAVNRRTSTTPLLKVVGSVVARLPSGPGLAEGRWDFNAPELASAYADWLKARADVPFNEKQLAAIHDLTVAKVNAQTKVVERLEKLVKAGTDPEKDLVAAQAELLQDQIQGRKDEHEAETNLKNAQRTLATLERQLLQAGIDPELLVRATESKAIVVAEVPEARVGLIHSGQACIAEFYAFANTTFHGRVGSLAPTLSKERRTLRVFFEVDDPQGRLKPGMFADIGLGADARDVLDMPADGVLHVGQSDYALVAAEAGVWVVTRITTGEQSGHRVEVLGGLRPGDRVIGAGAILLKPFVVQDVQAAIDPLRGEAAASTNP
jgi:DNA-binding protein H-NS